MTLFQEKVLGAVAVVGDKQVRRLFGISQPTLERWKTGKNEPHTAMKSSILKELEGCMAKKEEKKERATELEYLKWFRQNADFGPGDGDVQDAMNQQFMQETGKLLPKGWNFDSEGNEI